SESFLAINGDVWCNVDLSALPAKPAGLAHLLLVDNPPQHAHGDFVLDADGLVRDDGEPRLTFSGIGVYRSELLKGWRDVVALPADVTTPWPRFKLVPLLRAAMREGQVSGHRHPGVWNDVGTPARLAALRAELSQAD
ncbi:MAG: nucleotidyltransferase family protein, partial [Rhodanobacter sp.]